MSSRPRLVFLRSTTPYTTAGYYLKAFKTLDVELVDVPFDPHKPQDELKLPEGDFLLLVDSGVPVSFPALLDYPGPTGFVSIDSCHKLDIHREYCAKYDFDYIWVAQKHVVAELGPRAAWLPLGVDPETYVCGPDMDVPRNLWERFFKPSHYDIGMCGAPYPHRRRFEKLFKKAGLTTNFHYRKKFGREAARETAKCTIGFNVGAGFTGERGMDVNMRVFENMAGGRAMLLSNTYEGLGYEELFDDGVHYVGFTTEEEAVEKAVYYARHPDEARAIAEAGQRHVLGNHTYAHRCRTILETIGAYG